MLFYVILFVAGTIIGAVLCGIIIMAYVGKIFKEMNW